MTSGTRRARGGIRSRGLRPRRLRTRIPALLLVFSASPVAAQARLERPGAGVGASFERFSFADPAALGIESLSLLTVPFAGRAELTGRIALTLNGAWARGTLVRDGGAESSIEGLTDTEVRATFGLGTDAVTLSAIALLPTGQSTLDAGEAEVAGAVAADVLPLRISNWGAGGGFGASIAGATALGRGASAGFSLGWVRARDFEPVAERDDYVYRPGNQLHLAGALDASLGPAGKASLVVSYQRYDTDRANGVNIYRSGDRLQVTGSYAFSAGPLASGIVYAGLHHREPGDFEAGTLATPARDLILAGVGGRVPFGRGVLQPSLDLRLLRGTDETPEGYTATLGVAAEWPVSGILLAPTLRGRIGDARTPAADGSRYTGVEVGIGILFGAR